MANSYQRDVREGRLTWEKAMKRFLSDEERIRRAAEKYADSLRQMIRKKRGGNA